MRVRWVVLTLVLLAAGGAGGYGLGALRSSEADPFTGPTPVAAVSPSYPVNQVEVLPDPGFPALRTGLALDPVRVGSEPFDLTLPVPDEWVQSTPTAGEWRWYPPPGSVLNTYFLRVKLIGNQHQPIGSAVEARITALKTADDTADFRLVSQNAAGFVATYVSEGYRRVTMETYVATAGSETAFASIALIGRKADRPGMADLFDRMVRGIRS